VIVLVAAPVAALVVALVAAAAAAAAAAWVALAAVGASCCDPEVPQLALAQAYLLAGLQVLQCVLLAQGVAVSTFLVHCQVAVAASPQPVHQQVH